MTGVLILAVLILGGVELVSAQIPSVCANNANLASGVCCPNNCGGSERGDCVLVSTMCNIGYDGSVLQENFTKDGRFNWPSQIFTQVCQCKGNYGGYDCLDCKFGYGPRDQCREKQQERKSITAKDFDWAEYRNQLNRSKTEIQTRYKVFTGGNPKNESNYKSVTLYDLFAWMHHYVSWTAKGGYKMHESALDYAHESVGFLTWHRIYLLWFEREMQILLDDDDFTVRYWDWTTEINHHALFVDDRLGSHDDSGEVTGKLMTDWYIVCAQPDNGKADKSGVCDPTTTPGNRHVFRCGKAGKCNYPASDWPDETNVRRGINDFDNYRTITNTDPKIVNKYDEMSFSNYMEGFAVDDECENTLMGEKREVLCGDDPDDEIRRRLHNLVHVLVGIHGTIGDIPIAANDPVFINHHTMIDSLFEQWLMSHPNRENMYPMSLDAMFAGHAAGDCMVPFIPVYNHNEVFLKSAEDFGYSCDLQSFRNEPGKPGNGADSSIASAIMLVSMVVLCLVAVLI